VKANHLAYIGDAEIGRETNVGAGTITCNYDGFRKERTVVGERVMIGSDSQLIAPVTVGDDAYVATGTTVMTDVPAGALVFSRKPQEIRPGWVAERRARKAGKKAASKTGEKAAASKAARKKKTATPSKKAKARRPDKARGRTAGKKRR